MCVILARIFTRKQGRILLVCTYANPRTRQEPVTPRPQFLAGVPRILLVTVPTTTSRRAPPPLPPPPPPRAGAVARTVAKIDAACLVDKRGQYSRF